MHVWQRRAFGLCEMSLGAGHEGAKADIGERQDHVEVFVHVAVVEQMVSVQAAEPPGFFHPARLGQVHAPMNVFVKAVVRTEGNRSAEQESPLAGQPGEQGEGSSADHDEHRAVPPSHRDGFLVLLMDEVISVVRLEDFVMDHGVSLERVAEFPHRTMHDIFV